MEPVCKACWWDEGAGPQVGAWFTGRNETPERTWETRSQVVAADPAGSSRGRSTTAGCTGAIPSSPRARNPTDRAWEFLPEGIAGFHERCGDEADAEIEKRRKAAEGGIPATLAAIKKAAESG